MGSLKRKETEIRNLLNSESLENSSDDENQLNIKKKSILIECYDSDERLEFYCDLFKSSIFRFDSDIVFYNLFLEENSFDLINKLFEKGIFDQLILNFNSSDFSQDFIDSICDIKKKDKNFCKHSEIEIINNYLTKNGLNINNRNFFDDKVQFELIRFFINKLSDKVDEKDFSQINVFYLVITKILNSYTNENIIEILHYYFFSELNRLLKINTGILKILNSLFEFKNYLLSKDIHFPIFNDIKFTKHINKYNATRDDFVHNFKLGIQILNKNSFLSFICLFEIINSDVYKIYNKLIYDLFNRKIDQFEMPAQDEVSVIKSIETNNQNSDFKKLFIKTFYLYELN